jgi:hypothetical protein
MTTPAKRDNEETGEEHNSSNDSNNAQHQPETSPSKRPKQEARQGWMTYAGRRQPRVGNEYQVASLPSPESSTSTASDTTEVIVEEATPPTNSKADVDQE